MRLIANWIWKKQKNHNPHNQTVIARKKFRLSAFTTARAAVSADSVYRLRINGRWVNDGPARGWPEHYYYDVMDVASYLQTGENLVEIVACYFGVGTFHQVPQRCGLLAQFEISPVSGKKQVIATDKTWEVAEAKAWEPNTPKISIQMEPFEQYDARRESGLRFGKAEELFGARQGPWKDLQPRDCALLSRNPFHFHRFLEANVVRDEARVFCIPTARLLHPGRVEANAHTSIASAIATVIHAPKAIKTRLDAFGQVITVNGKRGRQGVHTLRKGANLLFCIQGQCFGHGQKEVTVRAAGIDTCRLENPIKPDHENPWCFIPLPESRFVSDDIVWLWHADPERDACAESYTKRRDALLRKVKDRESLLSELGDTAKCLPANKMLMDDPYSSFEHRQVIADTFPLVDNSGALIHDNPQRTDIFPSREGDVELKYDLGQQNCGYWSFELEAEDGLVLDIFAVEDIAEDGTLQHTSMNRNGLRYICRAGTNTFVSRKRRSGRYVFLTLRNQTKPVHIRYFHVVESTYPVDCRGRFTCSDPELNRLWEISARTLKLCMEDTFTDCPLYEQTLWVGDARNEALFAFTAFGATDVAKRCLRIAGQSLERYPIVGAQVPSSWDMLLPAWSFLWGIAVWDFYHHTGDLDFLKETWDWVEKNLKGAESMLNEEGLFSGPYWNMFDWSGIDEQHETVVHNSMFMVGAIDAALQCAAVLNKTKEERWLKELRARIVTGINALWDDERSSYPDSVYEEGVLSPSHCQHTSFLALLYDIVEDKNRDAAIQNALKPPRDMVRVGSPFAIMYLYEALEKYGLQEEVIRSIRANYKVMLDHDASTVWECFGNEAYTHGSFPTRSHCHAWSSAPIYFFNRIILGIVPVEPGGRVFTISPYLSGLRHAEGATATVGGTVHVWWERKGPRLSVHAEAPHGVVLKFGLNESHQDLAVFFNGRQVQ